MKHRESKHLQFSPFRSADPPGFALETGRKFCYSIHILFRKGGPGLRLFRFLWALVCCGLSAALLLGFLTGTQGDAAGADTVNLNVGQVFSQQVEDQLSDVLEGILPIRRVYRLSDSTLVAPKANPACYGEVSSPEEMLPVIAQAEVLLDGQSTFFTGKTPVREDRPIRYYLDDTLFTVTWKQPVADSLYTFAEVKIAHASQFRRFFSRGRYGSSVFFTPTHMSRSVNAVLASSGDFHGYREIGIVVNNGQVYRDRGHFLDTCYIDENGDLLFTMAGEITDMETAQKFVDEHKVRFSISFGPLIIREGECCVPEKYNSGEIHENYVRAALCQLGPLHYLLVVANTEAPYHSLPTMEEFASSLQALGVETAYCLDGGQTAAIALDHQLINPVSYGVEREISDILYFATALPEESWEAAE